MRTSLLAAIVGVHSFQGTRWTVAHQVPEGPGNHHPSIAPYGLFHAADGPIQIAVGSEAQWRALAPAVGLDPADPRYATNRDRVAHRESLLAAIDSALAAESSATWLERLDKLGIPAGRVRSLDQVYGWEQTRSQGLVITVDHPVLGRIELPGPPLRFDDQLFAGGRGTHLPPPTLGQHDDQVRAWLARPGDVNVAGQARRRARTDCLGGQRHDGARRRGAGRRPDRRHRHGGRAIAEVVAAGHDVVITHGNGPQVGNILVKNEIAASVVPPVPLDWCGCPNPGNRRVRPVERAGAQPR